MLWNRGFGCSGRLLVGMFWFGTCEVHGDLCPLCLTTQVSIIMIRTNLRSGPNFVFRYGLMNPGGDGLLSVEEVQLL